VYYKNDTCHTWPFLQPPQRLPLAKHADVNDMFKDTKCRGVIEESDSPWTSPLIFVQKDRSLWFFMNYRRLNFTKQGCFLLPRIKNTLDTLAGAKWFSTLDLNWILAGSTAS